MKTHEDSVSAWRRTFIACFFLFCIGGVYHVLFLRTFSHWWFEDDPVLFAFVRTIANPLRFFFDRSAIQSFSASLVPMQSVSMWIDSAIAYRSVRFAQIHHLFSLQVTLILLYIVLRDFGLRSRAAFALVLLWLCLPATVSVNEFLSARHYLEGFGWSLGAVLVAQKIGQRRWRETAPTIALLFVMLAIGALFKELYVVTVPLFVFFYLYSCRRYMAAGIALLVIPLYGLYRVWAFGSRLPLFMPLVETRAYLKFLGRFPYIFAGNAGGYLIIIALGLLCLWRFRNINLRIAGCALLLLCTALATIYPTTFAISRDWLIHGTWYRVMFFVNTIFLLGGGYWLEKTQTRSARVAALVLSGVILIEGGYVTERHWHDEMVRYKREGRYYLQHNDRLIYSELAAYWYLGGMQTLYEIVPRHYITSREAGPLSPEQAASYQTVWRYRDGTFVEDRQLYEKLRGQR